MFSFLYTLVGESFGDFQDPYCEGWGLRDIKLNSPQKKKYKSGRIKTGAKFYETFLN